MCRKSTFFLRESIYLFIFNFFFSIFISSLRIPYSAFWPRSNYDFHLSEKGGKAGGENKGMSLVEAILKNKFILNSGNVNFGKLYYPP